MGNPKGKLLRIRRPIRVYAETSVFGGVFDEEFSKASLAFLEQARSGKFLLAVSSVVEEEIAKASRKVVNLYQSYAAGADLLPVTEAAINLRAAYLQAEIVTPKWAVDALHVALATVAGCQMIVSWNFRHIVHYDKIALYNAINVKEGFAPIGIHTPQEVIEYED
jgi:predicted nucleic acid-binding protein